LGDNCPILCTTGCGIQDGTVKSCLDGHYRRGTAVGLATGNIRRFLEEKELGRELKKGSKERDKRNLSSMLIREAEKI